MLYKFWGQSPAYTPPGSYFIDTYTRLLLTPKSSSPHSAAPLLPIQYTHSPSSASYSSSESSDQREHSPSPIPWSAQTFKSMLSVKTVSWRWSWRRTLSRSGSSCVRLSCWVKWASMGRVARSMEVVRWASVVLLVFVLGVGGRMAESEVMGGAALVCPRWWGVRVC